MATTLSAQVHTELAAATSQLVQSFIARFPGHVMAIEVQTPFKSRMTLVSSRRVRFRLGLLIILRAPIFQPSPPLLDMSPLDARVAAAALAVTRGTAACQEFQEWLVAARQLDTVRANLAQQDAAHAQAVAALHTWLSAAPPPPPPPSPPQLPQLPLSQTLSMSQSLSSQTSQAFPAVAPIESTSTAVGEQAQTNMLNGDSGCDRRASAVDIDEVADSMAAD